MSLADAVNPLRACRPARGWWRCCFGGAESQRDDLLELVVPRALSPADASMALLAAQGVGPAAGRLSDVIAATTEQPHEPDDIFRRLRWGGQFLFASRSRREVASLSDRFAQRGFLVARRPAVVRTGRFARLPLLSRKVHYFTARKVDLTLPREFSDRFTYHVHLVPWPRSPLGYVVQKEVPSFERVVARLRHKFPEAQQEVIEKRARKFTEKIFPVFLTREAAMLQILERDLPGAYRRRVPHVIEIEKDEKGYVRKLRMNWLRNGGQPISQLEFAREAAELLHVLHDRAGVIHLDLRLDNFVLTEQGVGFVDFGSAVRMNEDLRANPMLATIFEELMKTSQIQRMLEQMTRSGHVTSQALKGAQGKVDKGVDLFYLAVQINDPLHNPDFEGLVKFDPASPEATALSNLTADVLKPSDPQNPSVATASDLLRRIVAVEQGLKAGHTPLVAAAERSLSA